MHPAALPCGLILAKYGRGRRPPLKHDRALRFFIAFSALFFIATLFIAFSALFLIAFSALFLVPSFPLYEKRQGFMPWRVAPQVRLELTTLRLTAECSAIELLRIIRGLCRGSLPARRSACQLPALLRSALATASASHIAFGPLRFGSCLGFAARSPHPASARCPVLPYVLGAGKTFVPPAPLGSRQLPTLPSRSQLSTISVWRLNFCVRYGYRWCPPAIVTGNFPQGSFSLAPLPAPSKPHSNRVDPQTFTLPNLPSLPFALSTASALSLPPLPSPSP